MVHCIGRLAHGRVRERRTWQRDARSIGVDQERQDGMAVWGERELHLPPRDERPPHRNGGGGNLTLKTKHRSDIGGVEAPLLAPERGHERVVGGGTKAEPLQVEEQLQVAQVGVVEAGYRRLVELLAPEREQLRIPRLGAHAALPMAGEEVADDEAPLRPRELLGRCRSQPLPAVGRPLDQRRKLLEEHT